ncbi:DUF1285 domain-containing protein [Erythrobacter insulae]|uniref:DUF1285 domain-containing protein n=1 Tax=Erythrobacter insulae TaxID=2584124 RepID=A0A547P961_9SPHN|nr:DUF1285 domain-containing protein [Erythrobacter insulae]TRD10627.1 DUF1285 domain-containing protein [Erythrobacter insulae]
MPYEPPPYLAELTLAQIAEQVERRQLPPVKDWSPKQIGDSDMRIAADGSWFHEGDPIRRPAMVRAFSGLLIRDDAAQHWLVTPFEKLSIEVDDAAFTAVDCVLRDGEIAFRLNTDDLIVAGAEHAIRAAGDPETPAIYVHVRHGCEARLNRSTYEQLVQIAIETSGDDLTKGLMVTSQGSIFSLIP